MQLLFGVLFLAISSTHSHSLLRLKRDLHTAPRHHHSTYFTLDRVDSKPLFALFYYFGATISQFIGFFDFTAIFFIDFPFIFLPPASKHTVLALAIHFFTLTPPLEYVDDTTNGHKYDDEANTAGVGRINAKRAILCHPFNTSWTATKCTFSREHTLAILYFITIGGALRTTRM